MSGKVLSKVPLTNKQTSKQKTNKLTKKQANKQKTN